MRRFLELDGIRGLSAVGVVAAHVHGEWLFWSWSLMEMFFVLSGFLITRIFLRYEPTWQFAWRFLARRAVRLWPSYFFVLLCGYLVYIVGVRAGLASPDENFGFLQMALFLQFVEAYFGDRLVADHYVGYLVHTWSLAAEEQFYTAWVLIFVGASRLARGARSVAALGLVLVLCGICSRLAGLNYWLTAVHLDSFGLGILGAAVYGSAEAITRDQCLVIRRVCTLAVCVGFAMTAPYVIRGYVKALNGPLPSMFFEDVTLAHLGFALLWFGLIGLSVTTAGAMGQRILRSRPAQLFGSISYSLYLVHLPMIWASGLTITAIGYPELWGRILGGCLSVPVAYALYVGIERPSLLAKDKVRYDTKPVAQPARTA